MTNSSLDNNFYFSKSVFLIPFLFVATMWLSFVLGQFFFPDLYQFGILPLTQKGLRGIVFHLFIHGSWQHLINNTTPIFLLLLALRFFYRNQFFKILFLGTIFTGFGTWLIGGNSYHVGISGLIYFLASFIFFKGIITKYFRLIALSMVIALFYGGMVWYMFPSEITVNVGISWESHLVGFVVGLVVANFLKTPQFNKPIFYEWQKPTFKPELDPFAKNFDSDGNFVQQKTPPVEEELVVYSYFKSSLKVIYDYLK